MARNRYSDDKTLVTAANSRLMSEGLTTIAAEFARLAALLEEFQEGGVEAGGLKSAMTGLDQIASFCGSVQKAYVKSVIAEHWRGVPDAILILQNTIDRIRSEAIERENKPPGKTKEGVQARANEVESKRAKK